MYKKILHATDLNRPHFHACERAAALAKQLGAELYLLHVIETPPSLQIAQGLGFAELVKPATEDAKSVLAVVGETIGVPLENQFIELGSPKVHILNKIEALGCDLVILARHTPNHLPHLIGSTTHSVSQHAKCAILILESDASVI